MPTTESKPLSCGGKGPCCHVGYAHRHCEHCDVVIATTYSFGPFYPLTNPVYPTYPRPWWANGTYNNFGNVGNAVGAVVGIGDALHTQAATTAAFPEHACEVK
jgi:hypothetical protein